jgi:hypothetical protein
MYSDALTDIVRREAGGKKAVYSIFDTQLPNPHTIQSMINVQRSLGPTLMVEAGYTHTAGRNFPLQRTFTQAFDRATGLRPNPALGILSGYYVSSEQTLQYNGLETSVRKRLSNDVQFDIHYTLSKGWAEQGGDLTAPYYTDVPNTQDFWNPKADRAPISSDARHRLTGDVMYEFPWLRESKGVLSQIASGWRISAIPSVRSGLPLRITQPSGMPNSRPDFVGGNAVFSNWGDTLVYLNRAAFALVPTFAATGATIRPGTLNPANVRGPARWTIDMTLGKTFRLRESLRLEVRADTFNALNHVNYSNPNVNITSPDFGKITSAGGAGGLFLLTSGGARTGQVGLRLVF